MFGPIMRISDQGLSLTLRPFRQEEVVTNSFADDMSSFPIIMHVGNVVGKSAEDEKEWFERSRTAKDSRVWAIVPDGCDHAIGVTSIHGLGSEAGMCSTGIIIYKKEWHSRGVGSLAHLARTWFVADMLNQNTIQTSVIRGNLKSQHALESVGYRCFGHTPRDHFRPVWDKSEDGINPKGRFLDTLTMCWINPERVDFLYPDGLEPEYVEAVSIAQTALEKARMLIQLD